MLPLSFPALNLGSRCGNFYFRNTLMLLLQVNFSSQLSQLNLYTELTAAIYLLTRRQHLNKEPNKIKKIK